MKREDLKKLLGDAATDEVLDKIMGLHGAGIEEIKTKLTNAEAERDTFKTQAENANQQIESFKGMKKPEEVDAAVAEWKTKAEKAEQDAAAKLAAMQYDHDLDGALAGVKAKNAKAVKALLDHEQLKDANGKFITERFNEQIGKIKPENDFLFEGEKPTPKIITKSNNQPVTIDPILAAMRKGAGLKPAEASDNGET